MRLSVVSFLLGGGVFAVSFLLHPVLLNPYDEPTAYQTILATARWNAIHVAALVGIVLWTAPLFAKAGFSAAGSMSRLFLGAALLTWASLLLFEAVAMRGLAAAGIAGFWAWSLAQGYLATAFDGLGLCFLATSLQGASAAYRQFAMATGIALVLGSPLAYAQPTMALWVLILSGGAWAAFTLWTAWLWWSQDPKP